MLTRSLLVVAVLMLGIVPLFRSEPPEPQEIALVAPAGDRVMKLLVPAGWFPSELPSQPGQANFVIKSEQVEYPYCQVLFGETDPVAPDDLQELLDADPGPAVHRDELRGLCWNCTEGARIRTVRVWDDQLPGVTTTFLTRTAGHADDDETIFRIVNSFQSTDHPVEIQAALAEMSVDPAVVDLPGLGEFRFPGPSGRTIFWRAVAGASLLLVLFVLEAFLRGREHRRRVEQVEEAQRLRESNVEMEVLPTRRRVRRRLPARQSN